MGRERHICPPVCALQQGLQVREQQLEGEDSSMSALHLVCAVSGGSPQQGCYSRWRRLQQHLPHPFWIVHQLSALHISDMLYWYAGQAAAVVTALGLLGTSFGGCSCTFLCSFTPPAGLELMT